jgi:hypothetical protein
MPSHGKSSPKRIEEGENFFQSDFDGVNPLSCEKSTGPDTEGTRISKVGHGSWVVPCLKMKEAWHYTL